MFVDRAKLEFENAQVLNLVQALLGSIRPALRQVSLECCEGGIHLSFLLENDSPAEREEIGEIEFEFCALQAGFIDIKIRVDVSGDPAAIHHLPAGRLVYRRWEL